MALLKFRKQEKPTIAIILRFIISLLRARCFVYLSCLILRPRKKAFFPYSLEGAACLLHLGGPGGGCVSWMSAPPRVGAAAGGGAVLGTEKVHQKGVKGLGSGRPVASSARTSASAVLKEALAPSESSESGENPNHHNKQTRWGALSRFQPTSASTGSPALSGGHVTLRGLGS